MAEKFLQPRGTARIGRGGRKATGGETQPSGLPAQIGLQLGINHACVCSRSLPAISHAPMLTETGTMTRLSPAGSRPLAIEAQGLVKRYVQLVGSDALPIDQQLTLEVARMIREYFLQQNAFHDVDTFSTLDLPYTMATAILTVQEDSEKAIAGGAGFL